MTDIKKTAAAIADDVVREYESSKKNSAFTYIRLARRLARSGITKVRALEIAAASFPAEHRAFLKAQENHEKLPPLFPPAGPSYAERRALAIRRGSVIN